MPISEGEHYIRNKGTGAFVQRSLHEDFSLLPKHVISVPPEVEANLWSIEKDGDLYVLKAKGTPAFAQDGRVFVSLLEGPNIDVKWSITAVPHVGHNVYLIQSANKPEGWVLPTEGPFAQVAYRPIIAGLSDPLVYPPLQLWVITPLVD